VLKTVKNPVLRWQRGLWQGPYWRETLQQRSQSANRAATDWKKIRGTELSSSFDKSHSSRLRMKGRLPHSVDCRKLNPTWYSQ